jgi:hypothetical protein
VEIGHGWHIAKLDRYIIESDTTYKFWFQNDAYSEIVDAKIMVFTKDKLKNFAKGLITVQTVGDGDNVLMDGYSINKQKSLGFIVYSLFYDDGYCALNPRSVKKLIEAIQRE